MPHPQHSSNTLTLAFYDYLCYYTCHPFHGSGLAMYYIKVINYLAILRSEHQLTEGFQTCLKKKKSSYCLGIPLASICKYAQHHQCKGSI